MVLIPIDGTSALQVQSVSPMRRRGSWRGRLPRPLRTVTAVVVVALLAAACGGSAVNQSDGAATEAESETLKVGLLVPLSGPYAAIGEDVKRGFELYLDQHDGELGGRSVELVVADEGASPATGIPAAQRLVNQDQVAVVAGIVSSAVAGGVRDIFDGAKIPLVLSVAAASGEPSEYIWRTSQTTGQPGSALGPHLAKQDLKSIYIIAADYVAGRQNVGAFADAYRKAGGTIAGESYTPFGQTQDWQPYLASIKQSGASAVYAFYAGAEAVRFVQQYDAFGLKESIPLYGTGFLTENDVLPAQGEAARDVYTSNNYSTEIDTPENKAFISAYTGLYDTVPSGYSVQAYDSAKLIDEAASAADAGLTSATLVAAMKEIDQLDSPRGTFAFDENNNPVQQFYLRRVAASDGGFVNDVIEDLGSVPAS